MTNPQRQPIFTPLPFNPEAIDIGAIHREKLLAAHYERVGKRNQEVRNVR